MAEVKPLSLADLLGQINDTAAFFQKQKEAEAGRQNEIEKIRTAQRLKEETANRQYQTVKGDVEAASGKGKKISAHLGEGGATYMENEVDPLTKLLTNTGQDTKRLDKAAQDTFKNDSAELDSVLTIHKLLDNPNSVDQEQIKTALSRLSEGNGQRLLQAVILHAGGNPSLLNDADKAANFLTGAAKSTFTPDQKDAIRQNLFNHEDLLSSRLGPKMEQYRKLAASRGPTLKMRGELDDYVNSTLSPYEDRLSALHDIRTNYQKQKASQPPPPKSSILNTAKQIGSKAIAATGLGSAAPMQTLLSTPTPTPTPPPTGPKPGDIEGGYRFKGGDRADQNNWEKVQ